MSTKEIVLEYAADELRFTGEPEEPEVRAFLLLVFRRIKLALKAARMEFNQREGQGLMVLALPAAGIEYQGRIAVLRKAGANDDIPYVCIQNVGGAYAWREIRII